MSYPLGRCLECGAECPEYRAWCDHCGPDMWRYGKMQKPKYCVEEEQTQPKYRRVKYQSATPNVNFVAEMQWPQADIASMYFTVFANGIGHYINIPMSDMQDLIDSLQAFYDQEKEEV